MRILLIILFSNLLIGCTAAGIILDGAARSQPGPVNAGPVVKDEEGFSFTKLGAQVDMAIVKFVKGEGNNNTVQVCRQVSKVLKECVEVEKFDLHTNEVTQLKTDYEMISVGQ
ncbi:hypothetical protein CWC16_13190 [Pseudoalteromonas sp. S3776]|uniref:hypothetical protein n=1 Tax=Pseudoalteromonas sp. S3776 TaxID=579544 RepID=UPI001109A975|nr:hypothetical protein [Pseudoalteromonas sp. S3776]TMO79213.1 hypothetical protein CWC16_13190 [Pseudoalteromonas sp. S3776]